MTAAGDIHLADLTGGQGNEQQGRPVLVISDDNLRAPGLVYTVPLTATDRSLAHHVRIPAGPASGLRRDSFAMTEQARALSLNRLAPRALGRVPAAALADVRTWVARLIGAPPMTSN